MAPIATQSPQLRPALPVHAHSRSSSFFSFLTKQSTGPHYRTDSMVALDDARGSNSPPSQHISPRINSPPAASNPPSGTNTHSPSLQQTISVPQLPVQQQMVKVPAQSPPSRDLSGTTTTSAARGPQPPQPPPGPPPLHPEIRSVVQLTVAHAHKVYFSGQLTRRIERQPDGQKPHKDEGWREVWVQLSGTILSIWDMQQIQEANQQGKQVPPTYVNVTDAVKFSAIQCFRSFFDLGCSSCKSFTQWLFLRQTPLLQGDIQISLLSIRRDQISFSFHVQRKLHSDPGLQRYGCLLGKRHV